jgi:hypothetical protein
LYYDIFVLDQLQGSSGNKIGIIAENCYCLEVATALAILSSPSRKVAIYCTLAFQHKWIYDLFSAFFRHYIYESAGRGAQYLCQKSGIATIFQEIGSPDLKKSSDFFFISIDYQDEAKNITFHSSNRSSHYSIHSHTRGPKCAFFKEY